MIKTNRFIDKSTERKDKIVKDKLLDLWPTSKLINEIVKTIQNALKGDSEFKKELRKK